MLPDTAISHIHGRHAVLAQRQEVMLRDGSSLLLHSVQVNGSSTPLLRALRVDGSWVLLNLADALPDLADDIRSQPRRDAHGLVFFHLRGRWGSAAACLAGLRPHLQPLQVSQACPMAAAGAAA